MRYRKRTQFVAARIEPWLHELMERVAKHRGLSTSDLIRFGLLAVVNGDIDLPDSILSDLKRGEKKRIAESLQTTLAQALKAFSDDQKARGITPPLMLNMNAESTKNGRRRIGSAFTPANIAAFKRRAS